MINSIRNFVVRARARVLANSPSNLRTGLWAVVLGLSSFSLFPQSAEASDWWWLDGTELINFSTEVPLSDSAQSMSYGSYELAGGESVTFDKWYKPKWPSMYAEFRTSLSSNLGLLWGFSTGERGEKYRIDPELSLGLHYEEAVTEMSQLAIVARTWLFGRLKEKSCKADYGQIGGTARVNCRLAASTMSPDKTLDYLAREKPEWINVQMQYTIRF